MEPTGAMAARARRRGFVDLFGSTSLSAPGSSKADARGATALAMGATALATGATALATGATTLASGGIGGRALVAPATRPLSFCRSIRPVATPAPTTPTTTEQEQQRPSRAAAADRLLSRGCRSIRDRARRTLTWRDRAAAFGTAPDAPSIASTRSSDTRARSGARSTIPRAEIDQRRPLLGVLDQAAEDRSLQRLGEILRAPTTAAPAPPRRSSRRPAGRSRAGTRRGPSRPRRG